MYQVGDVIGGVTVVSAEGRREHGENSNSVGPTYRALIAKDGFPTADGVTTLYESLEATISKYGNEPALGHRPIVDGTAQPYEWITYNEVQEKVKALGSAILGAGVNPKGKVGIFSSNTMSWMLSMQACNYYSMAVVPIYDSLGDNAVEYICGHAGVELIFLDVAKLPEYTRALGKVKVKAKAVIYWGSEQPSEDDSSAMDGSGIPLYSFEEFMAEGRKELKPPVPPAPEDLCTIMYTSGTTGSPKGVEVTHANLISGIAALQTYTKQIGISVSSHDTTLSYLPLAHIFDRIVEEFALFSGARIGYFQGDTRKITEDVAALKPTLFIAVPRVLERIQSGISKKVEKKGVLTRLLFNMAFRFKRFRINRGASVESAAPLLDKLVFNSVREGFGGKLRFVVSGGAPLTRQVQDYLQIALCCPVLQGYGLTETCAASFFTFPPPMRHAGSVGPPLPATEFRFAAAEEMGYDPFASPPCGEICIKGPMIFSRYHKDEEKTKESFDSDGFFRTGDIGQLTEEGSLKIVDRMKNIFKLSQGEYIAVEKLETDYSDNKVVEQLWLYGSSEESVLVAVVVPEKSALQAWAKNNNVDGTFEELCQKPKAKEWMVAQLRDTNKAKKLKGFEAIKAVILETHAFTVEDDLVTPSMKLKRPQLQKKYQKQIDKLYKDLRAKHG